MEDEEYYNEEGWVAVGEEVEEDYNPYSDYMVSVDDPVDTAVLLMVGRIKTRMELLGIAGASKEHIDNSKKKWIGDIIAFMTDKGILSNEAKASLLEIL